MAAAQVQHDRACGRCLVARLFSGQAKRCLTEIRAPGFRDSNFAMAPTVHPGRFPQQEKSFPPYLHGGHEATSRNEPGQFASFADYLP
jgi:hypothetical protein